MAGASLAPTGGASQPVPAAVARQLDAIHSKINSITTGPNPKSAEHVAAVAALRSQLTTVVNQNGLVNVGSSGMPRYVVGGSPLQPLPPAQPTGSLGGNSGTLVTPLPGNQPTNPNSTAPVQPIAITQPLGGDPTGGMLANGYVPPTATTQPVPTGGTDTRSSPAPGTTPIVATPPPNGSTTVPPVTLPSQPPPTGAFTDPGGDTTLPNLSETINNPATSMLGNVYDAATGGTIDSFNTSANRLRERTDAATQANVNTAEQNSLSRGVGSSGITDTNVGNAQAAGDNAYAQGLDTLSQNYEADRLQGLGIADTSAEGIQQNLQHADDANIGLLNSDRNRQNLLTQQSIADKFTNSQTISQNDKDILLSELQNPTSSISLAVLNLLKQGSL